MENLFKILKALLFSLLENVIYVAMCIYKSNLASKVTVFSNEWLIYLTVRLEHCFYLVLLSSVFSKDNLEQNAQTTELELIVNDGYNTFPQLKQPPLFPLPLPLPPYSILFNYQNFL
jgi:hypothetical protein